MQKNNKNRKVQKSTNKVNSDKIFNYDLEVQESASISEQKKATKQTKKKLKKLQEKKQKENEKLKAKKRKEIQRHQRELEKQEIIIEKKRKEELKRKPTEQEILRNKKIKKAIKVLVLIAVAITGIILLILSPIFNIKDIQVENNSKVSTNEIISLSQLEVGNNIYKIPNNIIKNNIKENAYINNVKIKRILPSKIKIIVTERTAEYMLELGSSYAYIDNQGYILEISSSQLSGKIKILGYETSIDGIKPGNRLCEADLDKLNTIVQIVNAAKNVSIDNLITSINISDDDNYTMYLESEKKTVYLGDNSNMDTKMLYIKKIISKEKDYEGEIFVNMDFRNKDPYFKQKV